VFHRKGFHLLFERISSHSVTLRASKLLNELKNEEFANLKQDRKWPSVRAGDAIEIKVLSLSFYESTDPAP
jgi:hypothetical protein